MSEHPTPPQKRLRVVFVHYRDAAAAGGSLRVGEAVAAHLDRRGFDPHLVFAYGGPGPVAASGRAFCHYLNAHGPADPLAWVRARALFMALDPGVIHYMDAVFWLRAALLGMGAPSLVHVHGPIIDSLLARSQCLSWRALAHVSSGHVCVSGEMRDAMLRHGWSDPRRTWVIANGVDTCRFAQLPDAAPARIRFGLPPGAFVLGMVGRMVSEKGCQEALDLMALLPPRFHLLMCGEGPQRAALESAAREASIADRIHFPGQVDDVRDAYAAMDAMLFLSRQESFGLVIAEAMAAGIPVVGLAGNGGYREWPTPLVTPTNSLLIERPPRSDVFSPEPPATIAHLASHILRVTSEPELLDRCAANARAWVLEHFDVRRQAAALERLYTEIALAGGAPA
jgi:glycosyltransferase involved in cell wall biosynthesis